MANAILLIFVAGAVGGLVNALFTDNGFVFPASVPEANSRIWRPGALGNVLTGGIAAVVSWGMYGPFSSAVVVPTPNTAPIAVSVTLASLTGAILVGVGGARWLSDQVDKKLLKAAASQAALGQSNPKLAAQIANVSPAVALQMAQSTVVPD